MSFFWCNPIFNSQFSLQELNVRGVEMVFVYLLVSHLLVEYKNLELEGNNIIFFKNETARLMFSSLINIVKKLFSETF